VKDSADPDVAEDGGYLPSAATIKQMTTTIRLYWSEVEHRYRGGLLTPDDEWYGLWNIPSREAYL